MCRNIRKTGETQDVLLDPEHKEIYTDSEGSQDGQGDKSSSKVKKGRKGCGVTMMKYMNRKHPGKGNGNSDVDEDEDQQSMRKIEGT